MLAELLAKTSSHGHTDGPCARWDLTALLRAVFLQHDAAGRRMRRLRSPRAAKAQVESFAAVDIPYCARILSDAKRLFTRRCRGCREVRGHRSRCLRQRE